MCPIPNAPPPACSGTPHGPGVTMAIPDGGSGIVLIQGKPAARVGDMVTEPGAIIPLPPPNNIMVGEFTDRVDIRRLKPGASVVHALLARIGDNGASGRP